MSVRYNYAGPTLENQVQTLENDALSLTAALQILAALQTSATSALQTAANTALASLVTAIVAQSTKQTSNSTTVTGANVILSSVQLVAANPNRKGFIVFNNSTNSTYITLGPVSVAATCSRLLATFASWEVMSGVTWTGPISAIRNAGSGVCTVFELT